MNKLLIPIKDSNGLDHCPICLNLIPLTDYSNCDCCECIIRRTDGIIQKVISEHNRNECKCKSACHNVLRIQQELIVEIKKELVELSYVTHRLDDIDFQNFIGKLIGDNKE